MREIVKDCLLVLRLSGIIEAVNKAWSRVLRLLRSAINSVLEVIKAGLTARIPKLSCCTCNSSYRGTLVGVEKEINFFLAEQIDFCNKAWVPTNEQQVPTSYLNLDVRLVSTVAVW